MLGDKKMKIVSAVLHILLFAFPAIGQASTIYNIVDVARLEHEPVGTLVHFNGVIILAGGGYWFVVQSSKCDSRRAIRIKSTLGEAIRLKVFQAAERSVGAESYYFQADIAARITNGNIREKNSRAIIIRSINNYRIRRIDCLKNYM